MCGSKIFCEDNYIGTNMSLVFYSIPQEILPLNRVDTGDKGEYTVSFQQRGHCALKR